MVSISPSTHYELYHDWCKALAFCRALPDEWLHPLAPFLTLRRYDGAFAWHWHNRWDDRIEDGSKFQRLEARIDERLIEMGLPAGPPMVAAMP